MLVDKLTVGADESRSHVRDGVEWAEMVEAALAGDPVALASLWAGSKRWVAWLTGLASRRWIDDAEAMVLAHAWEALTARPVSQDRWLSRTRYLVRRESDRARGTVPVGDPGGWLHGDGHDSRAGAPLSCWRELSCGALRGIAYVDDEGVQDVVDEIAATATVDSLCRRRPMTKAAARYAAAVMADPAQRPPYDPRGRRAFVQWRDSLPELVA